MPVTADDMIDAALRPIEEALQAHGITIEYLAKKLKEELDAETEKTYYDQREKTVIYSRKLPAWDIRQKARQDAHRLLNHYPAAKHEIDARMGVMDYNEIGEGKREKLRQAADEITRAVLREEDDLPLDKG